MESFSKSSNQKICASALAIATLATISSEKANSQEASLPPSPYHARLIIAGKVPLNNDLALTNKFIPTTNFASKQLKPLTYTGLNYKPTNSITLSTNLGFLFKPEKPFLSGAFQFQAGGISLSNQFDWDSQRNFWTGNLSYQTSAANYGLGGESLKLDNKPRNTILGPEVILKLSDHAKISAIIGARITTNREKLGGLLKFIITP